MNKILLSTAIAAAALLGQTAYADDSDASNPLNDFFVAGNLGQTQFHNDANHDHSVFQNVRFGWRWDGIVGPEIGYAYLGRIKNVFNNGDELSSNNRAATIGINAKYNFYQNWFVTGHTGYLRSQQHNSFTDYAADLGAKDTNWNNGWYAGAGIGYDVTKNVSVGVNYDNYRLDDPQPFRNHTNVGAYSASVEFRF